MKDNNLGEYTFEELKALNGKKLIDYTDDDFWELSLEKYRASKIIRFLVTKKNNHFDYKELSKVLEVSRNYVYQVMVMNVKPSESFIRKLDLILYEVNYG